MIELQAQNKISISMSEHQKSEDTTPDHDRTVVNKIDVSWVFRKHPKLT